LLDRFWPFPRLLSDWAFLLFATGDSGLLAFLTDRGTNDRLREWLSFWFVTLPLFSGACFVLKALSRCGDPCLLEFARFILESLLLGSESLLFPQSFGLGLCSTCLLRSPSLLRSTRLLHLTLAFPRGMVFDLGEPAA